MAELLGILSDGVRSSQSFTHEVNAMVAIVKTRDLYIFHLFSLFLDYMLNKISG